MTTLRDRLWLVGPGLFLVHLALVPVFGLSSLFTGVVGTAHWLLFSTLIVWQAQAIAGLADPQAAGEIRFLRAGLLAFAEIVIAVQSALLFDYFSETLFVLSLDALVAVQGVAIAVWGHRQAKTRSAIFSGAADTTSDPGRDTSLLWCVALITALPLLFDVQPPMSFDGLTYHLRYAASGFNRGTWQHPSRPMATRHRRSIRRRAACCTCGTWSSSVATSGRVGPRCRSCGSRLPRSSRSPGVWGAARGPWCWALRCSALSSCFGTRRANRPMT